MRLILVVGTAGPARGAATVTRGRLGGSREAVDPDLELTLYKAPKPTPRRPLKSRYGFVTEQPRMIQRAWWTYQTPYHGTQPYTTSGARVGTF